MLGFMIGGLTFLSVNALNVGKVELDLGMTPLC
jgi:hypothetical protein